MALTPVAELQQLMDDYLTQSFRLPETECVPIHAAMGRVLAQDVVSPMALPYANVSAMDGFALSHAVAAGTVLRVVGESAAGRAFSGSVGIGECIRVMTGAVVPDDCVTVVMQEQTQWLDDQRILITQDTAIKRNIRYQGEEIQPHSFVLAQGKRVRDADVMVLAALGIAEVAVYRPIKVAIVSTGDEVREPMQPLSGNAQIYDSNRYLLMAKLAKLPVEIMDFGIIPDDLSAITQTLSQAAAKADVIITSGGVSVGDYDYLRDAVAQLGQIHHYKVAMKPGKPFVFGQLGHAWYFGLAGNPVSGFVGFDVLVQAALWRLCGVRDVVKPLRFQAVLTEPVQKSVGRMDWQRAIIQRQADGTWTATPLPRQDSHRILGVSRANAYLLLPEECGNLPTGTMVDVQPFYLD